MRLRPRREFFVEAAGQNLTLVIDPEVAKRKT